MALMTFSFQNARRVPALLKFIIPLFAMFFLDYSHDHSSQNVGF